MTIDLTTIHIVWMDGINFIHGSTYLFPGNITNGIILPGNKYVMNVI